MNINVNVVNNIPGIRVAVNEVDAGNITIHITEGKRKLLSDTKSGDVIKIANREFIVLEQKDGQTVIIAKDFATTMKFGDSSDYMKSNVRKYCIEDFYHEVACAVGKENIIKHEVDLTADDGTGTYVVEEYVSVLTTEKYRKYRKFLPAMGNAWWTATRVTEEVSGYTGFVCYVDSDGVLGWYDCGYSRGVRPFLILDSSILVD